MIVIAPIALDNADSYRACLDVVAREGRYLAQVEALPIHCGSLGMGVHPALRGQGIGERLLKACIAKAKAKGITRIELETRVDNERAIRLYKKLGFALEARKKNAMRFDGVYYDALQMCLIQP